MSIEVRSVTKSFGDFTALQDVSVQVPDGELVALLGPSGSGKTTLLRVIAGLEPPDSGEVLLDGQDSLSQKLGDRRVGFVFQHYALFRHMSVFENVAFGMRVRPRRDRASNDEIRSRVHELLGLVQLDGMAQRLPSQLSGGQRQRVALARALAVQPRVLLLDEPFGALDARVRQELRRWLRRLHDELRITSVFVTHDQEEALEVADRVVVMDHGHIEQIGSPQDVYDHPATPFVYNFLGNVNLFHGRVDGAHLRVGDTLAIPTPHLEQADGVAAVAYVRPHDLEVTREQGVRGGVEAVVEHVLVLGPIARLELRRVDDDSPIEVELSREVHNSLDLRAGEKVWVHPRSSKVFRQEAEAATAGS